VATWQAHIDDKISSKEAAYDMIMGMDLIISIGITVDCEKRCIRWGGTEIVHIHSDASYLSVSKSRSRLGELFYLGYKNPPNGYKLNGSILIVASVIKNVVVSAAES
jgi:hypothetical protein